MTRDRGRRRLRTLAIGLAVVAVLAGGVFLAHSPVLAVRKFTVTGAVHESAPALRSEAGLVVGSTPMIDVDPAAAAQRIESLPWVEGATVARRWPWTVAISVVERRPVAEAVDRSGVVDLVDGTGRVLGPATAGAGPLPLVVGVGQAVAAGRWMAASAGPVLAVASVLPLNLRAGVREVDLVAGGTVDLKWGSTVTVVLGSPHDLTAKLDSLVTVLAKTDVSTVSRIDLTIPDLPTLSP